MSSSTERRGFLRSLVSLPLIGGGVTLIGNPVAVAEPVTQTLLAEYRNWLAIEAYRASIELGLHPKGTSWFDLFGSAHDWHERMSKRLDRTPSTRAAVVLSAVGCDWRRQA